VEKLLEKRPKGGIKNVRKNELMMRLVECE
jgi:hypothetical protein